MRENLETFLAQQHSTILIFAMHIASVMGVTSELSTGIQAIESLHMTSQMYVATVH